MDQASELSRSIAEVAGIDCRKGLGTAFSIAPGWWLTAAHVVAVRDEVVLAMGLGGDHRLIPAQVVARASALDAALLRAETLQVPPLRLSRSAPLPGSKWQSFGYPLPDELRETTGTRLPITGIHAGETQKSGFVWVRSRDVAPGVSGAPVCSGTPARAWAFVSDMLTAQLYPERARDFNLGVMLGLVIDALSKESPGSQFDSHIVWDEFEHDVAREEFARRGWTVLWDPASDATWRPRLVHAETPFFVHGDRPSPTDVARGDVYLRRGASEAAEFLCAQSNASVVVVKGGAASGKSSLALLIAWELHCRGATVLEALEETKSIREIVSHLQGARLLLLIEDARLHRDLLDRLKNDLSVCSTNVSLLIVDPPSDSANTLSYYPELIAELQRDGRVSVLDAAPRFSEVQTETIVEHIQRVFERWELPGAIQQSKLPKLLENAAVEARALKSLFTILGTEALSNQFEAATNQRPSWLTQKLVEWVAVAFSVDVTLPMEIAQRAAPGLPSDPGAGSFQDLQWTTRGFSFGHSEQAKAFRVASRVERQVELIDAAIATDSAAFVLHFVDSLEPGAAQSGCQLLAALPNGAVLRGAEAVLMAGLIVRRKLDVPTVLRHFERFNAPADVRGLNIFVITLASALDTFGGEPRVRETVLRMLQPLAPRLEREIRDLIVDVLHNLVRKQSVDWETASKLQNELRPLADASEFHRTLFILGFVRAFAYASQDGASEQANELLSELRSLVSHESATEDQRAALSITLSLAFVEARNAKQPDRAGLLLAEFLPLTRRAGVTERERAILALVLRQGLEHARDVEDMAGAARLLADLRTLAAHPQATPSHCTEFAKALNIAYFIARGSGDRERAHALLLELQTIASSESASHEQLAQLFQCLFTAFADATSANELDHAMRRLSELRTLTGYPQATEAERAGFALALFLALLATVATADRDRMHDLMAELRLVVGREHAAESERGFFADALFAVHRCEAEAGQRAKATELLRELRALSMRTQADESQRTSLARALSNAHGYEIDAGQAGSACDLLRELRTLATREQANEAQRTELAKGLFQAHRHASAAGDQLGEMEILRELSAMCLRDEATEEQRAWLNKAAASTQFT